VITQLQIINIY